MITTDQATKIRAVQTGASKRLCDLLAHFPIAEHDETDSPWFEVEVFLLALAAITFPEKMEDLMAVEKDSLTLWADADAEITKRLDLYKRAANGDIMPCGFWSMAPIDGFTADPSLRAFAMFGDFLVCPDSVRDYTGGPWPMLHDRDRAVFARIFKSRVLVEATKYVFAIAEVLREEE